MHGTTANGTVTTAPAALHGATRVYAQNAFGDIIHPLGFPVMDPSPALDEALRVVFTFNQSAETEAETRLLNILKDVPGGIDAFRAYDEARSAHESDTVAAVCAVSRREGAAEMLRLASASPATID